MIYFILSAKFCYFIMCATSNSSFSRFTLNYIDYLYVFCSSFYFSIRLFSSFNSFIRRPWSKISSSNCYDFNICFFNSKSNCMFFYFNFFSFSSRLSGGFVSISGILWKSFLVNLRSTCVRIKCCSISCFVLINIDVFSVIFFKSKVIVSVTDFKTSFF